MCEDDAVWEAFGIFSELMSLDEEESEEIGREAEAVLNREKFQMIKGGKQ